MQKKSFEIISSFFSSFRTLCIFLLSWNLAHVKGYLKRISVPILLGIRLKFTELSSIFCVKKGRRSGHAYRVNSWKELDETWHVGGVIIVGVPFGGLKEIRKKTTEIWHKTQQVSKWRDRIYELKIYPVIPQPFRVVSWKSVCSWNSHHKNSLQL